jgi:hypothetical protein
LCVSDEKCLQTIWDDITSEFKFKDIPYLNLIQDTIWNAVRAREMSRPLTPVEDRRVKEGIPRETVVKESFCRIRPDGIVVLPPVGNAGGIFYILEHARMSDACDRYFIRAKSTTENQYVSLRGSISTVIHRQGWKVEQISFITGERSVDKQDLNKNLKFFRVPEASMNSIYSKLAMRAFDVYANILICMYSTRFRGGATRSEASSDGRPTPCVVTSLTHTIDPLPKPDNLKDKQDNNSKIDSI